MYVLCLLQCIKQVLSHRGIKGEFLSDESVDKETKLYVKGSSIYSTIAMYSNVRMWYIRSYIHPSVWLYIRTYHESFFCIYTRITYVCFSQRFPVKVRT